MIICGNRLFTDCATVDGSEVCQFQENLVDCAPLTGAPQYDNKEVEVLSSRAAVNGETCRFPFSYDGAYYVDCVTVEGVESCKVRCIKNSGIWLVSCGCKRTLEFAEDNNPSCVR